ncbi:MAG: hypothetical protein NVSMB24_37630 [Mucilaginibacter sp.]
MNRHINGFQFFIPEQFGEVAAEGLEVGQLGHSIVVYNFTPKIRSWFWIKKIRYATMVVADEAILIV